MTSLSAADAAGRLQDLPGAFLAYGADAGGDVDAAFDDAVEQAGYDHGFARLVPTIASIDADQVTVADTTPLTLDRALLSAGRSLRNGQLEDGRAYAYPICADSAYKRRRVRITLTDPALEVIETAGPLAHTGEFLEVVLRSAAERDGAEIAGEELLESVVVTTARHRYKPIALPIKGASVAEYVVLDPATSTLISTGHRTAGDARRAAVALAKEGPIGGSATGHLEIVKVTRREDGNPLVRVERSRVASRVVAKATFAAAKNPEKTKTIGWLFYGYVPTDNTPSEATPTGLVEDMSGQE